MMENYQTPRGTQDLLPEATRKWQKVEDLIRNLCDVYGYGDRHLQEAAGNEQ